MTEDEMRLVAKIVLLLLIWLPFIYVFHKRVH